MEVVYYFWPPCSIIKAIVVMCYDLEICVTGGSIAFSIVRCCFWSYVFATLRENSFSCFMKLSEHIGNDVFVKICNKHNFICL